MVRAAGGSPGSRPDVGMASKASEHFLGREAELCWLRQELVRSRRVVLSGMGGMGKTQLALRYLLRHRARYQQGTFWIRGEEPAVLDGDLARLAELPGTSPVAAAQPGGGDRRRRPLADPA